MPDAFFLSVLNRSITASFVILVVLFVRLFFKKTPKSFSYALWAVVLFRLICPFSINSAVSLLPINEIPIPQNIVYSTEPQINTGINFADHAVNSMLPAPNNRGESINPLQMWAFAGSVIWAIGIMAMLTYSIIQFAGLKRKLIGSIPIRDNIYLADHINSPFVIGFIKPKIYLPSSIAETEQKFIIAHEQYHIKRFDPLTRIFAFFALAIHWFNPLVWLAFILSGNDMEMSCDEAVMRKMDTDIRAEYSQSLLCFAAGRRFMTGAPLAFGEGDTKNRIKNVMKYKKPMLWVSILAVIVVACVAMGLISSPKPEPAPKETKGASMEKLWENRTEFIGDNSAVGTILSELSFPENMQYKSFELKTKKQPYQIIIHFDIADDALITADYDHGQPETGLNIDSALLEENARVMFSLIGNVEKITFSVNGKDGGTLTNHYMRNNYDELFAKTGTYEGFQSVLDEIFYNRKSNIPVDFQTMKTDTEKDKIRKQFDETDYMPKKLTYDQAVASALFSLGSRYLEGECIAEGHIILGYDDSDKDSIKIYALSTIGWYGFENNHFVNVSGGAFPAVITLNSDNNVKIETPEEGSYYKTSIEKMFPKEYHGRIFKYDDADHDNLKQQEMKYASEYLLKIGRNAEIGENFDFEYTFPTDAGVTEEASNRLQLFYKEYGYYPDFIGTRERLENGVRMVYETSYHKNQDEIRFTKYDYNTKKIVAQFIADAKTGDIITKSKGKQEST